MYEPKNPFELAGYFTTKIVDRLSRDTKENPLQINFLGGTEEEVAEARKPLDEFKKYDELLQYLSTNPANAIAASVAWTTWYERTQEFLVFISVYGYQDEYVAKMVIPYRPKKRFSAFEIKGIELVELEGPHAQNTALQMISVISFIQGAREHPLAEVWRSHYHGEHAHLFTRNR